MNFKKLLTAATTLTLMASVSLAPVAHDYASIFAPSAISASAAKAKTYSTIEQEMKKFPQGKYWNHINGSNNADKWTNSPCTHHNGNCNYQGHCGCNSFGGGIQCWGFAEKIAYDIYHTYPQGSGKYDYKYSNIKAGDVVRDPNYGRAGHSYIVIAVNNNILTIGECNNDGQCGINWKRQIKKSSLSGCMIYHAPCEAPHGKALPNSTEPTPALGTVWVEGDTYIFLSSAQMYSDKSCKKTAGTIPKSGSKVIQRFFTAANGKDTIGMIDSSHYVYVKKNNVLNVRAFVITNYKTGVNFRSETNTNTNKNIICVIPNNRKLQVSRCTGKWAEVTYNGKKGWVHLSVCKG